MPTRVLGAATVLLLTLASLACSADEPAPLPSASPPAVTASPEPATAATPPPAVTASPEPATATPPPPAAPDGDIDEDALAAELEERVLASVRDEFGEAAEALTAHAFPVGELDEEGALWAVVSNGALPAHVDDDGNLLNFRYFVTLYRRNADATWSEALDALTLETDPLRVDVEVHDTGPRRARGSAPLIVMRGGTGAHSGTLDIVLVEGARLRPAVSHISARPGAGTVADLDGDGVLEIVLNSSNPYVFCYACAVEERSELIYRWDGVEYTAVAIEAPHDLEGGLAEGARRVVRLAGANLWREAGALAVEMSRLAPEHEGLRWLSIMVNRTGALRLEYAGSPGQPLLTNVFAGEYGAAYELMRAVAPEEAFSLDGPLIAGTAAEADLPTMVTYLLRYADEAVRVRDDDPAVHAVRALGQALASPDDLARARSSIGRALRLAPEDLFLQAAQAFLESIERASDLPPEAPEATPSPTPTSTPIPDIVWLFAEGISSQRRAEFQQEMAEIRDFFADRFGARASGFTVSVGDRDPGRARPGLMATTAGFWDAAHEYFHVLQYELAGGRSWGPHWLVEGSATYAEEAYDGDLDFRRAIAPSPASHVASIRETESADQVRLNYHLGFLAADWLVGHAGERSLLQYYRLLPDHDGWEDAFAAAFGLTIDEFYEQFEGYRQVVAPPLPHLTDDVVQPVAAFLGDVPDRVRSEIQAEMNGVRAFLAERFGAEATEYSVYVGADWDSVAAHSRRLSLNLWWDDRIRRHSLPLPWAPSCSSGATGWVVHVTGCDYSPAPSVYINSHLRVLLAEKEQLDLPPLWLEAGAGAYIALAYGAAGATLDDALVQHRAAVEQSTAPLAQLATTEGWAVAEDDERLALSIIAVDWLLGRAGELALFDYFRLLPQGTLGLPSLVVTAASAFEQAFGLTIDEFHDQFDAYRSTLTAE